jgi:hypothetical protein
MKKKVLQNDCLTRIRSANSKEMNYDFEYFTIAQSPAGHLKTVTQPKAGRSTAYTYETTNVTPSVKNEFRARLAASDFDGTEPIAMGNHIFILKQTWNSVKFDVLDKNGNFWQHPRFYYGNTRLDSLSHTNARVYVYPDRLIYYWQTYNGENDDEIRWVVFEYIGNEWRKTGDFTHTGNFGEAGNFPHVTIYQGQNYILRVSHTTTNTSNLRIHMRQPDGWSTSPVAEYLDVPNTSEKIAAAKDYFVYSYLYEADGTTTDKHTARQARVYRYNGEDWQQTDFGDLFYVNHSSNYNYTDADLQFQTFDGFFVVASKWKARYLGGPQYPAWPFEFTIRRWNPEIEAWEAERFADTDLSNIPSGVAGNYLWPRRCNIYASDKYIVVMESEPTNNDWMMVYRRDYWDGSKLQWKRSFIDATSPGSSPTIHDDEDHQFPVSNFDYAKAFFKDVDSVICTQDYFLVINNSDDFIWNFRWNQYDGKWISKVNGSDGQADANYQGLNFDKDIRAVTLNSDQYALRYFDNSSPGDDSSLTVHTYDYKAAAYTDSVRWNFNPAAYSEAFYVGITDGFKWELSKVLAADAQYIRVDSRCVNSFEDYPAVRVSSISTASGVGSSIVRNYTYGGGTQHYNFADGTGLFSTVTTWQADGTSSGKTVYDFALDSTKGMYGQLLGTYQISANELQQAATTDIVINGWLMGDDGYTPRHGWVSVGLLDPSTGLWDIGPLQQIDSRTGHFSITRPQSLSVKDFLLLYYPSESDPDFDILMSVVLGGQRSTGADVLLFATEKGFSNRVIGSEGSPYKWNNLRIICNNKSVTPMQAGGGSLSFKTLDWSGSHIAKAIAGSWNFSGVYEKDYGDAYPKAYIVRPVRQISLLDGVYAENGTPLYYYNSSNGLPAVSYTVNSDGTLRATYNTFAFEKYSGMDKNNAHMLSQSCRSRVYATPQAPAPEEFNHADDIFMSPSSMPVEIWDFSDETADPIQAGDIITITVINHFEDSYTTGKITYRLVSGSTTLTTVTAENIKNSPRSNFSFSYAFEDDISDLKLQVSSLWSSNPAGCAFVDNFSAALYRSADPVSGTVVSSSATEWSNQSGAWRPLSSYVWKQEMTQTGGIASGNTIPPFNFSDPSANNSVWLRTGEINKYDNYGHVLDAGKRSGASSYLRTVTIYGHKSTVPIATLAGVPFENSAVFTGDYDNDESSGGTNYFDLSNGWEKGQLFTPGVSLCEVTSLKPHFGQKSLRVKSSYGPTKFLKADKTANYIFSAWIYPYQNRKKVRMEVELYSANGTQPGTHIGDYSAVLSVPENEKWQYLEHVVKPSDFAGHMYGSYTPAEVAWYRIWVGNDPDDNTGENAWFADFSADDIRFYREDAFVNTTYYDPLWMQAICSVDPNNQPGKRITYDQFGRATEWKKIDRTKTRGTTNADKVVMTKQYHLTGETE